MKFTKTAFGDTLTILAFDHFVAMPLKIDFTEVEEGVVKAGTPISADGKKAKTTSSGEPAVSSSNAVGILLQDVYKDDPNGAVVIHGFIDTTKAKNHSDVTVDEETKAALPMIRFM